MSRNDQTHEVADNWSTASNELVEYFKDTLITTTINHLYCTRAGHVFCN